jgi:hypothetical protein
VVCREAISGTDPKTYEAKPGYDYRIYFYRNGNKVRVRLVGDKDTQGTDTDLLRQKAAGQSA